VLHETRAQEVADVFSLGTASRLVGPVAFGRMGEIWRLESDRGRFAVKQSRLPFDPDEVARDAAYQDRVRAAGVPMPALVRTSEGQVLAAVDGVTLRAYEWVDIEREDRRLDPAEIGRVLAAIHAVRVPAGLPVDPWSAEPVGVDRWTVLVDRLRAAGAPFTDRLADLVPDVLAAEALLTAPTDVQVCHRDLWADNVRRSSSGRVVVLDWENAGPAGPAQEVAMVAFEYGCDDPDRMRALYAAYVRAGGPGRVREPGDLTMLIAQTGHIAEVGCERWLRSTTEEDRADNAAWVAEFLDQPVTVEVVDHLLTALRGV
jgi:Ser/Thr protein kinase RdoA (MazF antagonist)